MATSTLGSGTLVLAGTTSGTTTVTATAVAGTTTLTLPAATDTLVGRATTDTLTNKTLTGAVMNGTLGATTPSTVAATTISASSTATFAAGAAATPSITTTGDTNTGIFFPAADTIAFSEGGAEIARFNSSGNFGLGVTPSAWGSTYTALQVKNFGLMAKDDSNWLYSNAFFNGTSTLYTGNGYAGAFDFNGATSGGYAWRLAASGTAGNNITFTQAMTLDASGNLIINDTSRIGSARLSMAVNASTENLFAFKTTTNGEISALRGLNSAGSEVVAINYDTTNSALLIRTGSTERVRIDSSGFYFLGCTTTPSASVKGIRLTPDLTTNTPKFSTGSATGLVYMIEWINGNGIVGSISTNGSLTSYNTTSDYRLKNITGSLTGAKDFIMALQPKQGTWKADGSKFVGFLAHEFQEISPSSVTGEKDAVDADGKPIMQSMQASSSEVIANLVAHIQNLETRLAALESA
jgi:hypothetical protein